MLNFIKLLLPYIKPYWKRVVGSLLLSFVLAGIKGGEVYLVKNIFDSGLNENSSFNEAIFYALLILALGVANFPARFFHFYWIRFVVDRATCSVRSDLFDKLQRLPMSFFNKNKQGTLISNVLNDTVIFSIGFRSAIDLVREPLTAIVMLGLAFYRDWQLTMIVIVVAPMFIIIFGISGKLIRKNQVIVQEDIADLTHSLAEGVSGQKVTKAFNLQKFVLQRFVAVQDKFFNSQMKTTVVEELAHPFVEFVGAIAFSGVIIFAHHRIASKEISVGDFVSFIAALALLMDPIRKYSQANVKMGQAMAAADRIFGVLGLAEEIDTGVVSISSFKEKIEIRNLSFSYGDSDVVSNLSLTINKGEKVALVGPSGSGKSTMVNLLLRLYDVDRGDILIDGVSIKDISLSDVRSLFGFVGQDIFLFHDTIKANLTIGGNYTDERIGVAIKMAYATDFINQLPSKEETVVGDRGTRLSGGQQQRVTIGRACLRNPEILLFDEATSALDNESEKVVQKALEDISGGKTVIAVAHRLSTIQNYDKIFVMKDGKIVESGNHQALISMSGEYKKLYEFGKQISSHET